MAEKNYTPVICIGGGLSGICLGITLQRRLGFTSYHIYEQAADFGGTWWVNTYPGCACDTPAALYSFSFAPNTKWTQHFPDRLELLSYIHDVADSYDLRAKTTFRTRCDGAKWDATRNRWIITLRNIDTGVVVLRECSVLISAVGGLTIPKPPSETADFTAFEGNVFHSARWDHSVDLQDKNVVVIGNGCSATQIIPNIVSKTRSLTQLVRSAHWILQYDRIKYTPTMQWTLQTIPFVLQLLRIFVALLSEYTFRMFSMDDRGTKLRKYFQESSRAYMVKTAPKKYHDVLIPDFEIGCKRRIYDSGYLKSLHSPNLDLVRTSIQEVLPRAVRTEAGTYPADVIILATGFETNRDFVPLEIEGRDGVSLREHWQALGGPGAYEGVTCAGFPNFFMILGANWATGHTSTLLAIENFCELAVKLVKPILSGEAATFEVDRSEEVEYVQIMQRDLRSMVFSTCANWYKSADGWNATLYPWSQFTLWWRCHFPNLSPWVYKK